jgi:DNA-binding NarL/FixJ family response regulator
MVSAIRAAHRGEVFVHPSIVSNLVTDYHWQTRSEGEFEHLTLREREVLQMVADGWSSREIAGKLQISLKTVQVHRTRIMGKLKTKNRTELIRYAMRKGLIQLR